jgi:hypothetical protein
LFSSNLLRIPWKGIRPNARKMFPFWEKSVQHKIGLGQSVVVFHATGWRPKEMLPPSPGYGGLAKG